MLIGSGAMQNRESVDTEKKWPAPKSFGCCKGEFDRVSNEYCPASPEYSDSITFASGHPNPMLSINVARVVL